MITNNWDENEVDEKMKDELYPKITFKFDSKEAEERLEKYREDQEFFCETCYESVDLSEACIMECGHG